MCENLWAPSDERKDESTNHEDQHYHFRTGGTDCEPIGSAMLWGGNPEKDGLYLPITPPRNDGSTIYKLTVGEVPVDGFWSVTVYNKDGYLQSNPDNVYSVNSLTAKKGADGLVTIQFGGCDRKIENCLPITEGWNYTVRLFRPRPEILNGAWTFPDALPVN